MNLAAIIGAGPVELPAGQPDPRGASKDPSFGAHLDESLSLPTLSEKGEEETDRAGAAILLGIQQGFAEWIAAQLGATDPDAAGARHSEADTVPLEVIAAVPESTPAAVEPAAGSGETSAEAANEPTDIGSVSAAPPAPGIPVFVEAPIEQQVGDTPDGVPFDPASTAPAVGTERHGTAIENDLDGVTPPDPSGREQQSPDVVARTTQQTIATTDRTGEPFSVPEAPLAAQNDERPKAVARTTEQPAASTERRDPAEDSAARQNPPAAAAVQEIEHVRQAVVPLEERRQRGGAPPRVEAPIDAKASSTAPQEPEHPALADVGSSTVRVTSGRPSGFEASTGKRGDEPSVPMPPLISRFVPEAIAEWVRDAPAGDQPVTAVPPIPVMQMASQEVVPRLTIHAPALMQPSAVLADVGAAATIETPRASLPHETADPIIQSLRMQYQLGGGDAVVHIKPEHLGPVSVSVRVENGVVSAIVNADNPAVVEWLKAHEHLLRDGLASSGLHLERFAVKRDGHPPDDRGRHWHPPEEQARRRRALQPESTFEITV